MYNEALCGIMDKLVFNSTPSGYVYVAEQVCPVAAISKAENVCPKIVPKMDHLVCFLPGTIRLGLESSAGHESMAVEMETQIRAHAIVKAIYDWEQETGELLFDDLGEEEKNNGGNVGEDEDHHRHHSRPTVNHHQSTNEEEEEDKFNNGVHVELNLPSRFKTDSGFSLVSEALALMESWLEPALVGNEEELEDGVDNVKDMKVTPPSPTPIVSTVTSTPPSAFSPTSGHSTTNLIKQSLAEILEGEVVPSPSSEDSICGEEGINASSSSSSVDELESFTPDADTDASFTSPSSSFLSTDNNETNSSKERVNVNDDDDEFCSLLNPRKAARALLSTARGLQRTCQSEYARTATGLAPEIVTFTPGKDYTPNSDARHSLLRPETLESAFVFFQLAEEEEEEEDEERDGLNADSSSSSVNESLSSSSKVLEEERDPTERESIRTWAWGVFDSIEQHARYRGGGYASVADVDYAGIGGPSNPSAGRVNMHKGKMESFALAETMKYLYLILADISEVDRLLPRGRTVLNTEAHPVSVVS